MVTARGTMPSRSCDHRPVTAAGLASADFMSRNLWLPYNLRLHRTLRHRHNLQFLHNRPAPKSAGIYSKTSPSGCFDRPGGGLDHPRYGCRLVWRDMALRECRGNRPHRGRDVADALDGRQGELDGAFAARRQKPFDAKPHGGRVAGKRKLDSFARQSLGLACEQRGGSQCRLITGAGPTAGGVARPALLERAPAHPPRQFW